MLKYQEAKFIVWTDFDGTITLQDSNDFMVDHLGFGEEKRKESNREVLMGETSFRESFWEMLESLHPHSFEECKQLLLDNIKLDPKFDAFYEWCLAQQIPVIVLSSGMIPIIRSILVHLLGPKAENIEIIANNVDVISDKEWHIVFHDDSHFGHDKSLAIKPYQRLPKATRPTMFYCGDGVSDLSAARETDLLFAKHGRDLITYCIRENIPYSEFKSFSDIHAEVENIVTGKSSIEKVAANRSAKDD